MATQLQQLSDGNPDGVVIGRNTDKVGFFGQAPTPQRADGRQTMTQAMVGAELTTYAANSGAIAQTAANTAGNQTFTATGVLAADFIFGVCANAAVANVGYGTSFIPTANTVDVQFVTPGAAATAAANGAWTVTAMRGYNTTSSNLWIGSNGTGTVSATAVTFKTASEQILLVGGANAVAGATINASGQIDYITVSNQGNGGYSVPPSVTITDALGNGYGATGKAQVLSGYVVSVVVTNKGAGYANYANGASAAVVILTSGTVVAPGMVVAVQKAAHQANLVVGECRVVGNNQIAVKFGCVGAANVTPTSAEAYKILAVSETGSTGLPLRIQANVANFANTGAGSFANRTVAVTGLTTSDHALSGTPTANATVVFGLPNIPAANTVQLQYGGVANTLPANGVTVMDVLQANQAAPVQIYSVPVTGVSAVLANTAAEQVFNLPSNLTIQANCTVVVNPTQALPANLIITGVRANSTGNIAINFMNVGNTSITPANQNYLVAVFPTPIPVIGANLTEGFVSIKTGVVGKMQEQLNELQQCLDNSGIIYGN